MFTEIQPGPIKPTGSLLCETRTKGWTVRFREGLIVQVYARGDSFDVFVDGQFVSGWRTFVQALDCADKY